MKKGFTLIEIILSIGLIVVIGIVSVFSFNLVKKGNNEEIKFNNLIKNSSLVLYDTMKNDKSITKIKSPNQYICVKIEDLIKEGLLKEETEAPDGKILSDENIKSKNVKIYMNDDYEIDVSYDVSNDECIPVPLIYLNGNYIEDWILPTTSQIYNLYWSANNIKPSWEFDYNDVTYDTNSNIEKEVLMYAIQNGYYSEYIDPLFTLQINGYNTVFDKTDYETDVKFVKCGGTNEEINKKQNNDNEYDELCTEKTRGYWVYEYKFKDSATTGIKNSEDIIPVKRKIRMLDNSSPLCTGKKQAYINSMISFHVCSKEGNYIIDEYSNPNDFSIFDNYEGYNDNTIKIGTNKNDFSQYISNMAKSLLSSSYESSYIYEHKYYDLFLGDTLLDSLGNNNELEQSVCHICYEYGEADVEFYEYDSDTGLCNDPSVEIELNGLEYDIWTLPTSESIYKYYYDGTTKNTLKEIYLSGSNLMEAIQRGEYSEYDDPGIRLKYGTTYYEQSDFTYDLDITYYKYESPKNKIHGGWIYTYKVKSFPNEIEHLYEELTIKRTVFMKDNSAPIMYNMFGYGNYIGETTFNVLLGKRSDGSYTMCDNGAYPMFFDNYEGSHYFDTCDNSRCNGPYSLQSLDFSYDFTLEDTCDNESIQTIIYSYGQLGIIYTYNSLGNCEIVDEKPSENQTIKDYVEVESAGEIIIDADENTLYVSSVPEDLAREWGYISGSW